MKKTNLLLKLGQRFKRQPEPRVPEPPKRGPMDWDSLPPDARPRAQRLLKWRRECAITRSVPSYVILHNATLEAVARRAPKTLEELSEIPGIGPKRLQELGPQILVTLTGE